MKMVLESHYTECYSFECSSQFQSFAAVLVTNEVKNVWCVARHDKNIIKRLTLAKIFCWTFRQLLLPSSAGMKNAKI